MKKTLPVLLLIILLTSCAHTMHIYSFNSTEGLNLFLRPVTMKAETEKGLSVSMDLTVPSSKSTLSGDGTLNYSILFPMGKVALYQNADLLFEVGSTIIRSKGRELLFLDAEGKGQQLIRYTSSLSMEEVDMMIKNSSLVNCFLKTETATYALEEKELKSILMEMNSYLL